ncbi:MAG: hypothetical protein Q9218_006208 [Villophora microphyllina]
MPYFQDSQQWLHQSTLLLAAHPTTVSHPPIIHQHSHPSQSLTKHPQSRITTKYRISPPPPPRKRKAEPTTSDSAATSPPPTSSNTQQPRQSRGYLVLKTYDPDSGVCLKYKTDKAAEVGRLVAALGKCGRAMAGLPPREEKEMEMGEGAGKTEVKEEVAEAKPVVGGKHMPKDAAKGDTQGQQGQAKGGGGGGGGKRKKGKRDMLSLLEYLSNAMVLPAPTYPTPMMTDAG